MKQARITLIALFASALLAATAFAAEAEADEHALGDPDAPVTIIEFASMSCPHCAAFHEQRFPWLKETYIDTGKVRFVFRDFPLNRAALLGAMVAHCAKPDQYFAYVDLLFARQRSWAFTSQPEAALAKLARLGGMGKQRFESCLADESLADQIIRLRLKAQNEYQIDSTPSFVIGSEVISGVPSEQRLAKLIAASGP